jgi:hypothetical protein
MGPLIWRELAVIWRTGSFWAATAASVSVLALFVVVWGDGVPVVNGGTSWQQFGAIQKTILILVLPWIAARCAVTPRRDLVLLASATASDPSRLLLARCVALTASFAAVAVCALPVVLLMQQIAAAPLQDFADQLVPLGGLATFVAVVTTGCMVSFVNPLRGWIAATAVTIAAGWLVPLTIAATPIWMGLALAAAAPLLLMIDGILTYLPEEVA